MTIPDEIHPAATGDAGLSNQTARPNYCAQCGATWLADWNSCPRCSAQTLPRSQESSGIGAALSLYFTLLGMSIVVMIAIACGARMMETEFAYLVIEAVVVISWCVAGRRQIIPVLTARVRPAWFLAAAIVAGCTFTIAAAFLTLLHRTLGVQVLQYAAPILRAGYGWPTVVLLIAVAPAVFEELAFRGVILTSLSRIMGPAEAGVVSAFMFMVLHLSVPSFPHLLLMGLALAYLRLKSGSVLPGMLLHFTHNLLCVVAERQVGPQFFH
jgi:membrane protease YdiL (CAAX protease family)